MCVRMKSVPLQWDTLWTTAHSASCGEDYMCLTRSKHYVPVYECDAPIKPGNHQHTQRGAYHYCSREIQLMILVSQDVSQLSKKSPSAVRFYRHQPCNLSLVCPCISCAPLCHTPHSFQNFSQYFYCTHFVSHFSRSNVVRSHLDEVLIVDDQ